MGDERAVSVLGGGPMARAITGALLGAGHAVTVWNRTPERLDDVVARGARRVGTSAEALAVSGPVLVNVVDHDALDQVLAAAGGAVAGRIIVGLSSDRAARAVATGRLVVDAGGRYLDGSIMTPVDTIGTPGGSLLLSGPEQVWDETRDVLAVLGRASWLGPELGAAATADVAALDFFWTAVAGYLHAIAVARAGGMRASTLAPHVLGMLDILPAIVDDLADRIDADRHGGASATIGSVRTSVEHLLAEASDREIASDALGALRRWLEGAIADGHDDLEVSALVPYVGREARPGPTTM